MNVPRLFLRSRRAASILLLCLVCGLPAARAARANHDYGLRLLQAQLPAGASLRRLDCKHLVLTVHAATLAHRQDVVAIFTAALTLDDWDARRKVEERLSCGCVTRIFHAAVTAAPGAAAVLLETAQALYPDCADDLAAVLGGLLNRSEVAVVSRGNGPDGSPFTGNSAGTGATATNGSFPGGDTTGTNGSSPDGDTSSNTGNGPDGSTNFGAGVGPGFPGAPGFSGSPSGGNLALPSPVSVAVTASVNN